MRPPIESRLLLSRARASCPVVPMPSLPNLKNSNVAHRLTWAIAVKYLVEQDSSVLPPSEMVLVAWTWSPFY